MDAQRNDLELAQQILTHDASDKTMAEELCPVYDLAVELACRIVERDRRTHERVRLAEVAQVRRLSVVREGESA